MTSFDCDDPTQGGGDAAVDTAVQFTAEVPSAAEFFREQGRLRADWIIAATGGRAKVLHVNFQGVCLRVLPRRGLHHRALATCTGCSVVGTVEITPPDLPLIRQKFETALLQAPQANAVAVDVDFIVTAGVQRTLAAANRPDLAVAGGECSLDSLGYLRDGKGVQMCIGSSLGYLSYAGIDALNRHFAGSPAVPSGLGWQLVTIDHNLPRPAPSTTAPSTTAPVSHGRGPVVTTGPRRRTCGAAERHPHVVRRRRGPHRRGSHRRARHGARPARRQRIRQVDDVEDPRRRAPCRRRARSPSTGPCTRRRRTPRWPQGLPGCGSSIRTSGWLRT